jgi:hypothetical protein
MKTKQQKQVSFYTKPQTDIRPYDFPCSFQIEAVVFKLNAEERRKKSKANQAELK